MVFIRTDAADLRVSVREFGDFPVAGGPIVPIIPVFPLGMLLSLADSLLYTSDEPACEVPWSGRLPMGSRAFRSLERLTVQVRVESLRPVTVDFSSVTFRARGSDSELEPEWVWSNDSRGTIVRAFPGCDTFGEPGPSPLRLDSGEERNFFVLARVPLDPSGAFEMNLPRIDTEVSQVRLPTVRFERAVTWSYEVGHL